MFLRHKCAATWGKLVLLLLLLANLHNKGWAAANSTTGNPELFDAGTLHEWRITIKAEHWFDTLQVWYEQGLAGAGKQFLLAGITIDGTALGKDAGIRFKGQYSNYGFPGNKKPFRIHFNKFSDKQEYQGIRKVNLHNLAGDPSFLREYIAYDLLRYCGLTASRTAFTRLYINDVYWGCYLIVEEPEDKLFLKNNFTTDEGNLFDAAGNTRLEYKGTDINAYASELKLQTKENAAAWGKLLQWLQLFNTNFDYDFVQQLSAIFNVDNYLKTLAVDVYLNNWDSYSYNGRNFFIYDENVVTQKLQWIPWDYNLSMWYRNMDLFPGDANSSYTYKPLIWRIKENTVLRKRYFRMMCALLEKEFRSYPLQEKIASAQELIEKAVAEDPNKFYTYEQFKTNAYADVTVNMIRSGKPTDVLLPGITALLEQRKGYLTNELLRYNCECDKPEGSTELIAFPNPCNTDKISIYINDLTDAVQDASVQIYNTNAALIQSYNDVNVLKGHADIDLRALQAGSYFMRFRSKDIIQTIHIIKL